MLLFMIMSKRLSLIYLANLKKLQILRTNQYCSNSKIKILEKSVKYVRS